MKFSDKYPIKISKRMNKFENDMMLKSMNSNASLN